MKRSAHLFIAVCTLFLTNLALAQTQTDAQKSFTQLKALAGEWQGTASDNHPVAVSFRETAGGSALLSEIQGHGPEHMISMIHMDGPNKLMLTHYCGAGNQPRMQAISSPDGKSVTFNFLDATNLASPEDGHMQSVTIAMLDANHHTEEWTFSDHGNAHRMVFDLRRK